MSKIKNYSRHIVVLLIAFATVFTCLFAFTPEANAGASNYKWRVSYYLDQGNNNTEGCYVKLYYKTNNGTGSESSVQIEGDDITFDKDKNGWYYWTSDASVGGGSNGGSHRGNSTLPAGAYPTKVDVYVYCESGSPAYQEFRIKTIKLEVMNQSGTVLATSNTADLTIGSSKDSQSKTATVSIGTGSYPYVTDWSYSGVTSPVKVAASGADTSVSVTVAAVDNYGVDWINAPTTTGSNLSVTSNTSKTPTLVFSNKSADYTATFTSTWSTANSSNSSVAKTSSSITVNVPHSLTIDTNGGTYSGTNPVTGKYTNETQSVSTPTRPAYTFDSWTKTAGNGSISGNTFTFGDNSATIKANWTPVDYTISPVYGDNTYSAVSYNTETTNISLPTPSRTGYTFAGWVVSAADGNWAVGDSVSTNPAGKYGNITVSPSWTPNNYTLNLNVNKAGAQVSPASKTVKYEQAIGELPVPTMTAYDFTGWFNASQGGTKVTADTVYTTAGNSTIYAQWTPTVYKFIIDENGGDAAADGVYNIEAGVIPAGTTRTGYTFSHWEVKESVGNWVAGTTFNPGASAVGKYGDVTLKAVYTPNNYTINFNLNAPAGAVTAPSCAKDSITVTFDSAVGTLPVPTLDGYDFAGWFTLSSGGTQVTESTVYTTASETTVYAKWTPTTYTIILDEAAGVAVPNGSYNIEAGVVPEGTTRTGYTFSHWKVKENAGNWTAGATFNPGDSIVGKYGEVTLVAVWTANRYTVSFDLNDTTGITDATADKATIQATYDAYIDVNETLPVATRPGYNFLGWFTQPEGGEEINESFIYTVDGESTYYAHWSLVTYTVTFDVNNGDPLDPITYTVEDELVLPEATREGYNFVLWRLVKHASTGSWVRNSTYTGNLGTKNWGNVTLTADYAIVTYTITWVINGETETSEHVYGTYPDHADPAVTTDPYYEYLFKGWDPEIDIVKGDATYTAIFDKAPKAYSVKWVDEDGETIHSGLLGYGETIPTDIIDVPEKEGYTGAWDYKGNVTMPAENLVIKPVYTPKKYKVTWNVEGNEFHYDMVDYDSLPVYSGSTPVKASDSKYSYTFSGWTPELAVVKGEATYEATFEKTPNNYTIFWYAEDGNLVAEHVLAYGSAITNIPQVPEKIGSVGSWVNVPETMPDHNVEIYPAYVKGALVTWYLDGTSTGAYYQQGFENGTQIEYNRSNPEKPADAEYTYKFEGWSLTPGGELISGYPVAGSTDIVYYAVYSKTANEYTITWKADGNVVLEETLAFGSGITNVPAVPEKTGHTGAWNNIPDSMPAYNLTIDVKYTPNDYTITWVVGDDVYGTIFTYGTMPKFTGVTYKPSTATTDFTFIGWDKEITLVEGDTTYTAQYSESARKYTVTWQYENGAIIDTDSVANGAAITYIPAIADKEGHDAKYVIPEVMPTENITIVVTYEAKSYTITWSTPTGIIEETWKYGETPVYNTDLYGVPTKEATAEKQYTFLAWNPTVSTVKGDTIYTAVFTETARKYTVVWYVDGEFYETRDIAYGSVIPTLSVPQKNGYIGNWDNPYRTMPARDLTINAEYTARKYTVYWKVEGLTVYSASVSYGDAIPAQKVPDKTGHTGNWVNVPDKMPAENITITAEYTANEYKVTWRVNSVDYTDIAKYGVDYVITFTGETIPEDVRITVGGTNLAEENYSYNLETGVLTINGAAILGDIFVTARALGGKLDLVINTTNASLSNQNTTINERQAFHTEIIPEKGYLYPDFVEIYIDGRLLTEGYVYNSSTGKLTINAEVIIGAVEITFDCPPDPNYDPSAPDHDDSVDCDCNCHSTNSFTSFFFKLATFLRKLFGMDQYRYCDCGAAHW